MWCSGCAPGCNPGDGGPIPPVQIGDAMSDLNEKIRVKCEENTRDVVYGIIDAHSRRMEDEELKLWESIHKQLCALAVLYEKRGYEVWKH